MAPECNSVDLWAQALINLSLLGGINTHVELEAVFSSGVQLLS